MLGATPDTPANNPVLVFTTVKDPKKIACRDLFGTRNSSQKDLVNLATRWWGLGNTSHCHATSVFGAVLPLTRAQAVTCTSLFLD